MRGPLSQLLQKDPRLSGSDHTTLLHMFRCRRGRGQEREVPPRPPVPSIAPHCPGPGQDDCKATSFPPHAFFPSSHSSEFRPAEIRGHVPQGETHPPPWKFGEGLCGGNPCLQPLPPAPPQGCWEPSETLPLNSLSVHGVLEDHGH